MAADTFNYDDLADLRYNSFTNEYSPKIIGYGSSSPEERTIPSTSPFIIKLFESPLQTVPLKTKITLKATGEILKEVAKGTTPANKQYAINYDERGNGQVLFNSGQAGQVVYINYYGLGTLHQRSTLKFQIFGSASTKIVASSNSPTGSQEIADEIISTGDDAAIKLKAIIDELNSIGGGEIKILEGTYNFDTRCLIDSGKDNIRINGSGYSTIFFARSALSFQAIFRDDGEGNIIENILIDCNNKATTLAIKGNPYETQCKNIKVINCAWTAIQSCYYIGQSFVDGALTGFSACAYMTKCRAENCTSNAFSGNQQISNCVARNNSGIGFSSCFRISECYSELNSTGFNNCTEISSSYAYDNTNNGFDGCDRISVSRAENNGADGFDSCENITSSYSVNNTGNGFDSCKAMGFNYSTGNSGSNYNNCFADRAGTQAAADTAVGGYNG